MDAQQTIPASGDARETAAATITADAAGRLALDDVMLADIGCQQDDKAIADIARHLVVPVVEPGRHHGHGALSTRPYSSWE